MEDITIAYLTDLFTSSNPSQEVINKANMHVKPVVDHSLNVVLCEPFSDSDAVFDMHPSKPWGQMGFLQYSIKNSGQLLGRTLPRQYWQF